MRLTDGKNNSTGLSDATVLNEIYESDEYTRMGHTILLRLLLTTIPVNVIRINFSVC